MKKKHRISEDLRDEVARRVRLGDSVRDVAKWLGQEHGHYIDPSTVSRIAKERAQGSVTLAHALTEVHAAAARLSVTQEAGKESLDDLGRLGAIVEELAEDARSLSSDARQLRELARKKEDESKSIDVRLILAARRCTETAIRAREVRASLLRARITISQGRAPEGSAALPPPVYTPRSEDDPHALAARANGSQ